MKINGIKTPFKIGEKTTKMAPELHNFINFLKITYEGMWIIFLTSRVNCLQTENLQPGICPLTWPKQKNKKLWERQKRKISIWQNIGTLSQLDVYPSASRYSTSILKLNLNQFLWFGIDLGWFRQYSTHRRSRHRPRGGTCAPHMFLFF